MPKIYVPELDFNKETRDTVLWGIVVTILGIALFVTLKLTGNLGFTNYEDNKIEQYF